ncbi:putative quinol monooxygenase [uncultured Bilophila sp.]|uniref:putative quinol monooxygenase n=1 Tax=uncultured Bilophila sp. TaxID=529385 RepID=UPI00280BB692|nr:putative quinol monooxygenase [uncultured Bilophila sp.]
MDTCYVTAMLTAKKGMEAQLEAEVVKNIPNVRAEKGCIRYDFHKNRAGDGTFLFYEIWESPEALDAHGKAPHMLAYKESTKGLLACPTVVNVWSQVDCK